MSVLLYSDTCSITRGILFALEKHAFVAVKFWVYG